MEIKNQMLRMSDLANLPAKSEKSLTDKTGRKRLISAKPASRGIIGFSAKHIYHLIECGQFPKPIKIGRASLWRSSDIEAWINAQGENHVK